MSRKRALIHLPALLAAIERRIYVIRGHKVMRAFVRLREVRNA
jgi:hypothetical protein